MKITQDATFALQAEQQKFAKSELELQRSWFARQQAVAGEHENEREAERKSLRAKSEGLTAIDKERAQQVQTEEEVFEKMNRDAVSFRDEELAQNGESLIKKSSTTADGNIDR